MKIEHGQGQTVALDKRVQLHFVHQHKSDRSPPVSTTTQHQSHSATPLGQLGPKIFQGCYTSTEKIGQYINVLVGL